MKRYWGPMFPVLMMMGIAAGGVTYLNCAGGPIRATISAEDLRRIGQLDLSELTPAEIQRLDNIVNREVSPCGNEFTLAQTILNPNLCPLTTYAVEYLLDLLKQDYNEEEVVNRYVDRYASLEGLSIPRGGSPHRGPAAPDVWIVVFSAFECPFCAPAAQEIDRVAALWPDHVGVVFKYFPLSDSDPGAMLGARAAYAAHQQGKFWEMHDVLFSRSAVGFGPDTIRTVAVGLGMDGDQFDADLISEAARQAVKSDGQLGREMGVTGTPRIFVNGRVLDGGVGQLENRVREEFLRMGRLGD